MKITIRQVEVNGNKRWCIDWTNGRRNRLFFKTKSDAETKRAALVKEFDLCGSAWSAVSDAERFDLLAGLSRLRKLGKSLNEVLNEWEKGTGGKSTLPPVTIEQAVNEFLASRKRMNVSQTYTNGTTSFYRGFIKGRESMLVSEFTQQGIEEWLDAKNVSPISRNSYIKLIQAVFNYCVKQEYLIKSPTAKIAKTIIKGKSIFTLNIEQIETLLKWTFANEPQFSPWLVVALFCGVRPSEADRMNWEMIRLDQSLIRLPGSVTKTGQGRDIHLEPSTVEWLKLCQVGCPTFAQSAADRQDFIVRARGVLGFDKWPHDCLRHTAASMHVGHFRNCEAASLNLGHSIKILRQHYLNMIEPDSAKKFWSLSPTIVTG